MAADDDDVDSSATSSSEDDEPSMVVARSRRVNAGNRMAKLMAMEENEPQDEVAEAYYGHDEWKDAPDDAEFEDLEHQDDIALESDSDPDEDEGEDEDEDAGEKALRKQERAEKRTNKRKLQAPLFKQPAIPKKRKIESTETPTPSNQREQSQNKGKKSERVSWLPVQEDGPVRSSKRTQTVQNKEQMHSRLKEKEANRLQLVASMKAAEDRKKNQPPPMTQEERLAMAEQVEQENVKTLNKWEDAEKMRQEEQRAWLEARKNKQLEGQVIRYWSGPAIWADEKLKVVGRGKKVEDLDKKQPSEELHHPETIPAEVPLVEEPPHSQPPNPIEATGDVVADNSHSPSSKEVVNPTTEKLNTTPTLSATGDHSLPSTVNESTENLKAEATDSPGKDFMPDQQAMPVNLPPGPLSFQDDSQPLAAVPDKTELAPQSQIGPSIEGPQVPAAATVGDAPSIPETRPTVSSPPHSPVIQVALRNLVTLRGFGLPRAPTKTKEKDKDREILTKALLQWPTARLPKPNMTTCPITGRSARYRDPGSGLPYHDTRAYNCIQRLSEDNSYQWSNLIGAYVGFAVGPDSMGRAAAGVPERFTDPLAKAKIEKPSVEPTESVGSTT